MWRNDKQKWINGKQTANVKIFGDEDINDIFRDNKWYVIDKSEMKEM